MNAKETKNGEKFYKKMIKKRILPTLLISFMLPFMIFISIPFDIYGNNLDEFLFNLGHFFPILIGFFFLTGIIVFFAILFLPKKAYKIVSAILISVSFMFFLQSTYLNGNLNSLSGDNLSMAKIDVTKTSVNAIVWIVVITIAILLSTIKDKKSVISTIAIVASVVVVFTQVITTVSASVTKQEIFLTKTERLQKKDSNATHEILTTSNLTDISKNRNIFYFCVDRFDEDYAEKALTLYPEVYDELTGFTWFQDNISLYGHTYPAVAHMLTNQEHDSQLSSEEYLKQAYEKDETLKLLNENGYKINLYTQSHYAYVDASHLPDYVQNVSMPETLKIKNHIRLAFGMVRMALYRGFPLILKNLVSNINSNTCNYEVEEFDKNGNQVFSTDMKTIYEHINSTDFNKRDDKVFSFIHFDGCHTVSYDEDWNEVSNPEDYPIEMSVKTSFDIINKYIKEMKLAGVYKDATIIITGDHAHPIEDNAEVTSPRLTALFVKPSGEDEGDVKVSNAQTSHENIWATILKSEQIETDKDFGKSVFEIAEDEDVVRRYVWHAFPWGGNLQDYIYEIRGSAKDFNNWKIKEHKDYENKFLM